jgi:hypothetical protein
MPPSLTGGLIFVLGLSPALAIAQDAASGVPEGFTFAAAGDLISPKPFKRILRTSSAAKDPARANIIARLKGDRSKRPLLIVGHSDT